jgi:hypothetical protein
MFYQIQVEMTKNESWEMVMKVLQLVFNAYRSFVMIYEWFFYEKDSNKLKGLGISKIWFFKLL